MDIGKDQSKPRSDFKMNEDGSFRYQSNNGEFDIDKFNLGYEQYKRRREKNKRIKMREKLDELNKQDEKTPIYSESIGKILINTKDSLFQILDDLLQHKFKIDTFTKNNRLFYIGLILIFIASFMYLYTVFIGDEHDLQGGNVIGVKHMHEIVDLGDKKIFVANTIK